MCTHTLRDYGLVQNLPAPPVTFSSIASIFPTLPFRILQSVFPTVLSRVISLQLSRLTSPPSFERSTTTPPLHLLVVYSFSHIQPYSITITVIISSPECFRILFTILSVPPAFLFFSLAMHSITSSLVNSLRDSFKPPSSRVDASALATAHVLIYSSGFRVEPRVRFWCSLCTLVLK